MVSKRDLLIMAHLRKNGRVKLTAMSRMTHLPVSTIFDRMKQQEGKAISRHISLLDFNQLGFHCKAAVLLKVSKKEKMEVRSYLDKHMNVNSLYRINNGYDFLAECIFRNINELELFLDSLEEHYKVKAKQVLYVIEDIKRECFLSDPNMIEMMGESV